MHADKHLYLWLYAKLQHKRHTCTKRMVTRAALKICFFASYLVLFCRVADTSLASHVSETALPNFLLYWSALAQSTMMFLPRACLPFRSFLALSASYKEYCITAHHTLVSGVYNEPMGSHTMADQSLLCPIVGIKSSALDDVIATVLIITCMLQDLKRSIGIGCI